MFFIFKQATQSTLSFSPAHFADFQAEAHGRQRQVPLVPGNAAPTAVPASPAAATVAPTTAPTGPAVTALAVTTVPSAAAGAKVHTVKTEVREVREVTEKKTDEDEGDDEDADRKDKERKDQEQGKDEGKPKEDKACWVSQSNLFLCRNSGQRFLFFFHMFAVGYVLKT